MAKMEIELTEEQLKKVELLKENDIDVGKAIDMLFELKDEVLLQSNDYLDKKYENATKQKEELEAQISEIEKEISVIEKLKDTTLDVDKKQEILEKEYGENRSYEIRVQDAKHKISWARDFFKF